eukprot:gene35420-41843_t
MPGTFWDSRRHDDPSSGGGAAAAAAAPPPPQGKGWRRPLRGAQATPASAV